MDTSQTGARDDEIRRSYQSSTPGRRSSAESRLGESNGSQEPGPTRPTVLRGFREPSIRLRRALAASANLPARPNPEATTIAPSSQVPGRRFRSVTDPQATATLSTTVATPGAAAPTTLPVLREETTLSPIDASADDADDVEEVSIAGSAPPRLEDLNIDPELVDILDVVDPEVSTLMTLTNVQNSLFVPDLGRFLSRRPIYTMTPTSTRKTAAAPDPEALKRPDGLARISTLTSTLDESRYAVLPHGVNLRGWSVVEKEELNDHVRHMLHSKRSKIRRGFQGFISYVKKPLGFLVTLYATLITIFGLAWVLFLIGWINLGGKRSYVINVIDNVLVALFAIVGDGLAPFRLIDTYNMFYIVHYHRLTWKLIKRKALPKLTNKNDLPTQREENVDSEHYIVLSEKQQASLEKHERRFCKSHTFYKPHETATHFAFPVKLLVAIVVLLDCHSLFQIALGACTWGINYHHRPFALTTVILCCSITCNITAAVLISIGDHRTRKEDVLERIFRQDLTSEVIEKMEKRKQKERERNEDLDKTIEDGGPSQSFSSHAEKLDNDGIEIESASEPHLKTDLLESKPPSQS